MIKDSISAGALAAWLDELRDKATCCGYAGDSVADAGPDEWAEYFYDGWSVDGALVVWAAFEAAAESWLVRARAVLV